MSRSRSLPRVPPPGACRSIEANGLVTKRQRSISGWDVSTSSGRRREWSGVGLGRSGGRSGHVVMPGVKRRVPGPRNQADLTPTGHQGRLSRSAVLTADGSKEEEPSSSTTSSKSVVIEGDVQNQPSAPAVPSAEGAAGLAASPPELAAGMADLLAEDTSTRALTEGLQFSVSAICLPGVPAVGVRHVETNGQYLVVKTAAAALLVWRLEETEATPTAQAMGNIVLPHPRVECLSLQDGCGHLLVTCAQTILLRDLRKPDTTPLTLGEDFSGVSCCHLSAGGEAAVAGGAAVLALGIFRSVWLLDTERVRHLATLRGHDCDVTSVTVQGALCVAGSEAGQVKVWEVVGGLPLYTYSCAVSPRPVGAITADLLSGLVAAGCGSQVTVAAGAGAGAAGRWTDVASADLERPAAEGRSSSPRPECAVLSLRPLCRPSRTVFGPHSLLLVATTAGLSVLNTRTWLPLFTAPNTDGEPWGGSSVAVTPGGAAVVCGRGALQGHVSALWLTVSPPAEEAGDVADRLRGLSIVCRDPLPARSVLRARPCRPPAPGGPSVRVRSSGYGAAPPRRTMFQPHTNGTTRSRPAKTVSSRLSLSSLPPAGQRPDRSRDIRPVSEYRCHVTRPPTAGRPLRILRSGDALLRIAVSGNGRHLACTSRLGGSLEVARIRQLEVTQDQFLLGTEGAITSVDWSLSGTRLAAVSSAGVQLWSLPGGEVCGRRPPGSSPFTAAQFFFTDEFLLASRGDTVELSRLPPEGARSSSGGGLLRTVLQCRLPCREVQHVAGTCQVRSTLAVACCSDCSLRVVDVQVGDVVLTIPAAHRRPAHLARLCEGSPHLSPAGLPLYDLVGSAAVGDGVRFWDVRSGRLAVRLPVDDLRTLPAGFQFSPCCRLVALGSDSAVVRLWDLRRVGGPLARLRTAAVGVSDVAFLPRRPGLVAALLDGRVQTWPLDDGRDP